MNQPIRNLEAVSGSGCASADGEQSSSAITQLILPTPPSVNAMFRNVVGVGRVPTKLYEDWKGHAGWKLRSQKPTPIHGGVIAILGIERTSLAADIDNRVKALFDLLVAEHVIDDDKHVVGFAIAWSPARDGLARVAIMPAAPLTLQFQLAPDGAHGGWYLDAPQLEREMPDGDLD